MRSELRTALAVLSTTAVLLGSATMAFAAEVGAVDPDPTISTTASPSVSTTTPTTPIPTATPTPDETDSTPEPGDPTTEPELPLTTRKITDAQLRWGINDESNNRAFAPGTFNFLSAGKIGNPGEGGKQLNSSDRGATWAGPTPTKDAGWSASSGNVKLEKYLGGSWTPATWAGTRTTSAGTALAGTNGPFSNHEVVISGGTGTVDPTTRTASIQWTGSFTVIYYSGFSFFYVSDPKLTVTNGLGTLTGTLGGYGSSMEDLSAWTAVPDAPDTVLADLGQIDLTKGLGFTAQPRYTGVGVEVRGQTTQARTGSSWGSFPQSFIDYQLTSGTGSYWYSSGGSADAHKVAKPVTVSYSSTAPVTVKPPSTTRGKTAKVKNDAPELPANEVVTPPSPAAGAPAPAAAVPVAADQPPVATAMTQLRPASTIVGAQSSTDSSGPVGSTGVWILGGVLLAAAALIAASPFAYASVQKD